MLNGVMSTCCVRSDRSTESRSSSYSLLQSTADGGAAAIFKDAEGRNIFTLFPVFMRVRAACSSSYFFNSLLVLCIPRIRKMENINWETVCPLLLYGLLNLLQLLICFFLDQNQVTRIALPSFSGWQRTCGKLFLFKSSFSKIHIWLKFSSNKPVLPLPSLK